MAATIKIKNSSTAGAVPTASDLVQGELAINVTDRRIYTENASGTVVELGTPSIDDNGNATAITIDSSENVGIGTGSPTSYGIGLAAVAAMTPASYTGFGFWDSTTGGAANVGGIITLGGNDGSSATRSFASIQGGKENSTSGNYASYLRFATRANGGSVTERMRIDSSGNVGIGVTPSAWKSGYVASQVGAGGYVMGRTGATVSELTLGTNSYFDTTDSRWEYIGTGLAAQYGLIDGQHRFYTAPTGLANGAVTWTQAMTLDASGNLGIGTSSPSTHGTLAVDTAKGVGGVVFGDLTTVSNNTSLYLRSTGESVIATGSTGNIVFKRGGASGTETARIDSSGNVLVTGAGGLGYGTGSGGTVTQATSRTTGVTINKTNGAITLVSAAGSTTIASFTVTNSTVAATDTIHICQKSGTDLYRIYVTNVAAGSFKVSFATLSGTTTEQPVFNFAVIKAVTA